VVSNVVAELIPSPYRSWSWYRSQPRFGTDLKVIAVLEMILNR